MTTFIAIADETCAFPGIKVIVEFGKTAVNFRALGEEKRERRGDKEPSMLVGVGDTPPATSHLVHAAFGVYVYETYWSLATRVDRLITRWESKVSARRNAINPILTVVADTTRLLLLRAVKRDTTEFERQKYSELSALYTRIMSGEPGTGDALTECFWVCRDVIRVIREAERGGWRQTVGGN